MGPLTAGRSQLMGAKRVVDAEAREYFFIGLLERRVPGLSENRLCLFS
jgi:hypothetical protein